MDSIATNIQGYLLLIKLEIFEKRKYLGDVQKIISVFVDVNNWFNIRRSFEYSPICVDHKGLYLNFRFVKDILRNLDGKK